MKKADMSQAISDFRRQSVVLCEALQELLPLIQDGFVPTHQVTSDLNHGIENLNKTYTDIVSLTRTSMLDQESLAWGQSVFDYDRIYQENYILKMRSQFATLKQLLQAFICVQSKAASYIDALHESQLATRSLLERMEEEIPEEIERTTQGQRLFMQALRHEGLDSADGEQLLDELEKFYPSKVLRGLMTGKYFETDLPTESPHTPVQSKQAIELPKIEQIIPENQEDETVPPDHADEPEEDFLTPLFKLKDKTPSAAAFQKELLKCGPEVRIILPLLTHAALLTADQIFCFVSANESFDSLDALVSALNTLVSKHLLASYECEDGRIVYCLTAYCCGCLKKETIRTKRFWALQFGTLFYSAKSELPLHEIKSILEQNDSILKNLPHPEKKTTPAEDAPPPPHAIQTDDHAESVAVEDPMLFAQTLLQTYDAAGEQPPEQAFLSLISLLLERNQTKEELLQSDWMDAILLAKTTALIPDYEVCTTLYRQLVLATAVPMKDVRATGVCLMSAFDENSTENERMMLAAYLYAMFAPDEAYDHTLQVNASRLFDEFELHFPSFPMVKPLFHVLLKVQKKSMTGFSEAVLSRLGSESAHEAYLNRLQERATALTPEPIIKAKMHGLPDLLKACFGLNSTLHDCMDRISAGQKDPETKQQLKTVLSEYCEEGNDSCVISESRIENVLDLEWKNAKYRKSTFRMQLSLLPRQKMIEAFHQRLELIAEWLEATDTMQVESSNDLKQLKVEVLDAIPETRDALSYAPNQEKNWFILHILGEIQNRLLGKKKKPYLFAPLLRTGIFSLDAHNLPIIRASVLYYEPWRNALRHIAEPVRDVQTVQLELCQNNSALFDNLNQRAKLNAYLNVTTNDEMDDAESERLAEEIAELDTTEFLDALELADMYHQIDKNETENILSLLTEYKDEFFEIGDFGCWRAFLTALKRHIDVAAETHGAELYKKLDHCRAVLGQDDSPALLDAIQTLITEQKNFALAGEYLLCFARGDRSVPHLEGQKSNEFLNFLSADCYDKCTKNFGKELKVFGVAEEQFMQDRSREQLEERRKFLNSWVSGKGSATPTQVKQLLDCLGFPVLRVEQVSTTPLRFKVYTSEKNQTEYTHPIAAFGTRMQSPFDVLCLHESLTADALVSMICAEKLEGFPLVLLDRPLDRAMRRQISGIFHNETRGETPFLMVDQALALYLSGTQAENRLNVLLKCTLPYSLYEPFSLNTVVSNEMFFGRVRELQCIADLKGTRMMYGAHKLGKTALLTHAETLYTRLEKREYAVRVNLSDCTDEAAVTARLIQTMREKTKISLSSATTLNDFCAQLQVLFQKKQISVFRLLLDDTDAFLQTMEASTAPIQALLDLSARNQFKCVFSALHQVQGSLRDALGCPLAIGPLLPKDARRLLQVPLEYLGFLTEGRLDALLINTNYYPSLVHLVGDTLTQTVTDEYEKFYCAAENNPPFPLEDRQLGVILNSAALNQRIRDGICAVLESDPRYFMLAHCIALLYYYNSDDRRGNEPAFTVLEIKQMAEDYDIHCLETETVESDTILLDEMTEMGILTTTHGGDSYYLRQHCFLQLMGSDFDCVDKAIHAYNDEVNGHD